MTGRESIQGLMATQFRVGKWWWQFAVAVQAVLVLASSALAAMGTLPPLGHAGLAAAMLILSAARWHADALLDHAERVLRVFERIEVLGWAATKKEVSDLWADAHPKARGSTPSNPADPYWGGGSPRTPEDKLLRIQESAWWSQHLAGTMFKVLTVTSAVTLLTALTGLAVSAISLTGTDAREAAARVALAVVSVLVTGGFVRLAWSYHKFSEGAGRVDEGAQALAKVASDELAARVLWDYQLLRSKSPPIPELVWSRRKDELNKNWSATRAS